MFRVLYPCFLRAYGVFALFPRPGQGDQVAHNRVVHVSKARHRAIAGHIKAAVDNAIVAQMNACDFANDHEIVSPLQGDHLQHLAFQRGRGSCDTRAINGGAVGLGHARFGEFIGASGQGGRCGAHPLEHCFFDDVDGEDAAVDNVGNAVFHATCKHHLRRGVGDGVEERIGCEIVAMAGTGGNPRDGAGRDYGLEGIVSQTVAIVGFVKHRRSRFAGLNLT